MRLAFWLVGRCSPQASPPACREHRAGRCRPGSAASSATRCCGCRRWCSAARPASAAGRRRRSSASARLPRSRSRPASAITIRRTSSSTSAGRERPRAPRTTTRSATSISLGWLVHGLLSLKARIVRLVTRRSALHAPQPIRRAPTPRGVAARPLRAARSTRIEPTTEIDEDERGRGSRRAPRAAQAARARAPAKRSRRLRAALARPARRCRNPPTRSRRARIRSRRTRNALESVLGDFGVRGEIINARPGPVVTLYELEPAPGIKSSRVIGLADDIARSMSAVSARVAVVSGRNAIGIELPNPTAREGLSARAARRPTTTPTRTAKLPLCLGKTIGGEPVIVDLARMPHLLIAGTTGSGKSVAINTMILSLLYRLHARAVPADHGRSRRCSSFPSMTASRICSRRSSPIRRRRWSR